MDLYRGMPGSHHSQLHRGPGHHLFNFSDGSPLTRNAFVRQIRTALSLSGIYPAQYSGHSFYIGAATSAAAAGVPDALIQTLGRWKSTVCLNYIKVPPASLASG